MKGFLLPSLLVLSLGLAGCYTVPETGRKSMIMVSAGEESALGATTFEDLKAKEKVSTDSAANDRVQRVGRRIADAVGSDLPSAKWEFVVFDAPKTMNAFALPGGKVGVYSGLLDLAKTDDELATVMGHEIAHVTARHGSERMTEGMLAAGLGVVLDASTRDSQNRNLILGGYGLFAGGSMLAFSRSHESEADYIGIRYAAKAGYDPRAAITFWQSMARESKRGSMPVFLSTHPSDERRIADLEGWMPQVLPLYEASRGRFGD